jgi:hypothetical protein
MVVVWGVRWNTVVSGRLREERKGTHEVELVEELHDLLPVQLLRVVGPHPRAKAHGALLLRS